MADMYGALRSSEFKVKDPEAFKAWFFENCYFGDNTQVWDCGDNLVAFGGDEQYPSAYPRRPLEGDDYEYEHWILSEFATAIRKHLAKGEELQVVAAGHEKLRYVGADVLIVPAKGKAVYLSLYSDSGNLVSNIKAAAKVLK